MVSALVDAVFAICLLAWFAWLTVAIVLTCLTVLDIGRNVAQIVFRRLGVLDLWFGRGVSDRQLRQGSLPRMLVKR